MPKTVDTQHPQYIAMSDLWQNCRDAAAGSKAVKAAGKRYLPELKDQTIDDYNAYKARASWFGATWRTIDALKGMMFRKAPEIETAGSVKSLLDDVTLTGKSLHIFAQQTALEVLTSGRVGILVDYPKQSTEGLTRAEAEKLNLRPILAAYQAESIINWKTERIGNATVLSLLVLTEQADLPGNEYEHKKETHYRVLDLVVKPAEPGDDTPAGRVYRVRVYRINKEKDEDEQIGADLYPLMNGKPLPYIPFIFLGVDDTTPEVDEPPLIDLVDVNLDHYRLSADLKHGLHFGGLPTPWIAGYTEQTSADGKPEKLYIGSAAAWCFPDPQAKAGYLEFTGQGLEPISKEMGADEQRMAILGARLLSAEKKDAETSQTAQIHRAGESSVLSSIAQTLSIGLTQALKIFSEWAGTKDDEASIEINREFLPPEVTPEELKAWLASWQAGAPGFSDQGFFDLLKQREMVREDVTLEDEQQRISSKPIPKPGVDETV